MKLTTFSRFLLNLLVILALVGSGTAGAAYAAGAAGASGQDPAPGNAGPAGAAGAPEQELVLLSYPVERSLQPLQSMRLQVYAQFYAANGDNLVLLPLEARQKTQIEQLGFKLQTIEAHQPGKKEAYYLVYGLDEALGRVLKIAPLLWLETPQALVRIKKADIARLTEAGVQLRPLFLSELVVAPVARMAPAAPDAPAIQAAPEALVANPVIQDLVNQVQQAKLSNSVGGLSGEWPVTVNGSPYTFLTRYSYAATPITKATRYGYERLQALGLTTWYDYYYMNGVQLRNVVAQQTGSTQPNKVFLLIAHLDSYSNSPYSLAPGADDNASGSAALLAIAEILRQVQFGCTLRYILFTGEEQGYYGSKAYAADPDPALGSIIQVLNLDMLGYSAPGSAPTIELHTRYANSGDLAIANLFKSAVGAYGIPLTPLILQDGKSFSDHSSFWAQGYPAIMAIEDWTDHTPYYHLTGDQLETLNMAYYTNFTKAALATFAHMGCLVQQTKPYYLPLVKKQK